MWRLELENNAWVKNYGVRPKIVEGDVLIRVYYLVLYPEKNPLKEKTVLPRSFLGRIEKDKGSSHRLVKGDWVIGYLENEETSVGEFLAVAETALFKLPENYSFQEAATLPFPARMAYQLLQEISAKDLLLFGKELSIEQHFFLRLATFQGLDVFILKKEEDTESQLNAFAEQNINFQYAITNSESEFSIIKKYLPTLDKLERIPTTPNLWSRFLNFLFLTKKSERENKKSEQEIIQSYLDEQLFEAPQPNYFYGLERFSEARQHTLDSSVFIVFLNP